VIRIGKLSKFFSSKTGSVRALDDIDLAVQPGEFFVLLGASGSGKTTLLRCVAGLERPDSGEIALGQRVVFSAERRLFVAAEEREIGMVFQSYAIWPHLTVAENVALPLTQGRKRPPKAQVKEKVGDALRMVGMDDYADRPAPLLSGGQQQRIALARALAVNPQLLLMDEPLSNLDARLREEVRTKLKSLVGSLGITVLYVTHDQVEAMVLADRIAVMAHGSILQIGTPGELYRAPASPQVAEFFGSINWLNGEVSDNKRVKTAIGTIELNSRAQCDGRVVLGIRPEDVRLRASPVCDERDKTTSGVENEFAGEVRSAVFVGDQRMYEINIHGKLLLARAMADGDALSGKVSVRFSPARIAVFPETASFTEENRI
jgi:iron(III) transport system ATP-binding protein